ncbi:MAG: TnpV protein [Clostridia bacterium]|nr:TnpV protein [Clostridia bacterium]MBQ7718814.1 TnpV protein [Clostridia bacterium]
MTKLTYRKVGDYYLPNLSYSEIKRTYGKYGMMREEYLKNHKTGLWNRLILHAELVPHLNEIDRIARERLEIILPDLMKSAGVTEELKQKDQLKWVGLANACKAQTEEIIIYEIIFS